MTKHFIFDFDGTLVDSMPYWGKGMVKILDKYDITYPENIISVITPLGVAGTIAYFKKLGLEIDIALIQKEIEGSLIPAYRDIIPAKKGVVSCLGKMKSKGYGLHVLTASNHVWMDPCLKRLGLDVFFDNIWSTEDFMMSKTDPKIYRLAAERIGAEVEDITFLDDNINADKAAKLGGVKVIGVYDISSKDQEQEIRNATDEYIYDFTELEMMI